ncbi:MAG: VanZ family protein [Oscillospiraceae bacterium]|nr:VanZ family protein [Oscillospiraceae bacterium]
MVQLYRESKAPSALIQTIGTILIAAAYSLCCLPSFYRIGHFALQIFLAFFLSFLCTALLLFLMPRSLLVLGKGLSVYLLFFLGIAVYDQTRAQIAAEQFSGWINTFFYDKPLTVSIVWATPFVCVLVLRIFIPFADRFQTFREDFRKFYHDSVGTFIFFYICVLLYCFVLQRKPGIEPGLNLVPFSMILSYLNSFSFSYESLFYLVGNVLCFFPFGFFYKIRKQKPEPVRTVLLPVILSLLIEVSQLLFRMGDFDIDDILMNAAGFYLGLFIAFLMEKIRSAVTKGEERSIF